MNYICKFCENKFHSKEVQIVCPICGEDYFIEKIMDKKISKQKKGEDKK